MKLNVHVAETDKKMPDGERQKPKLSFDGSINIGTMIHLIILVVTITLAWGAFDKRTTVLELEMTTLTRQMEAANRSIDESSRRTERIEHYLLSKDPKYLEQFGASVDQK